MSLQMMRRVFQTIRFERLFLGARVGGGNSQLNARKQGGEREGVAAKGRACSWTSSVFVGFEAQGRSLVHDQCRILPE